MDGTLQLGQPRRGQPRGLSWTVNKNNSL